MVRLSFPFRLYAFISDVHLEKWKDYQKPFFNHQVNPRFVKGLLLGGDIGYPKSLRYKKFIQYAAEEFSNFYLISGNHEYDNITPDYYREVDDYINDFTMSEFSNVFFLQNSSLLLEDNTKLLGSTLWTNRRNNELHMRTVGWLNKELKEDKKTIILTHHLPSKKLIE